MHALSDSAMIATCLQQTCCGTFYSPVALLIIFVCLERGGVGDKRGEELLRKQLAPFSLMSSVNRVIENSAQRLL